MVKRVPKRTITLLVEARLYEDYQKFCYKQGCSVSGRFCYLMRKEMEKITKIVDEDGNDFKIKKLKIRL